MGTAAPGTASVLALRHVQCVRSSESCWHGCKETPAGFQRWAAVSSSDQTGLRNERCQRRVRAGPAVQVRLFSVRVLRITV